MVMLQSLLAALLAGPALAAAEAVYAHVIVGNTGSYGTSNWASDASTAASAGIDGFALNIAPPNSGTTSTQIANAFNANLPSNFCLFFSFDYLGGGQPWAESDVINILQTYSGKSQYCKFDGKPLVSTFEGTSNINDWNTIKSSISGGITFIPDWTSLGPSDAASQSVADGLFSWDMWPDGPNNMTSAADQAWVSALNGRPYMMGASPWFFTDLPNYNKAWVWRGDSMWHTRWTVDIPQIKPALVEIVTWNDFGESHYIGPIVEDGIPPGASGYTNGFPHDAWRNLLPYYISNYKTGSFGDIATEELVVWYRLAPAANSNANGQVTGNDCKSSVNTGGYQTCYAPDQICEDGVFVVAVVKETPATLNIKIGDAAEETYTIDQTGPVLISQPFGSDLGNVTVQLQHAGTTAVMAEGPAIMSTPPSGTNFNTWVGGASAAGVASSAKRGSA